MFDSEDAAIKKVKGDDSMRRREWSSKINNSAYRCITFRKPMGLNFEHTIPSGARASKKCLVQWWGSTPNHKFDIEKYKNYFLTNQLKFVKSCWVVTDDAHMGHNGMK